MRYSLGQVQEIGQRPTHRWIGDLDWARTSNLQLRRLTLYPIELRGQSKRRRGRNSREILYHKGGQVGERCAKRIGAESWHEWLDSGGEVWYSAQWAGSSVEEHLTFNQRVVGSIPTRLTILTRKAHVYGDSPPINLSRPNLQQPIKIRGLSHSPQRHPPLHPRPLVSVPTTLMAKRGRATRSRSGATSRKLRKNAPSSIPQCFRLPS